MCYKKNCMNISKKIENGNLVISLEGKLNSMSSPLLENELSGEFENINEVHLDFTNLRYISSAGLRVLLIGAKKAAVKNISIIIDGASESIMEVFTITGFNKLLRHEKGHRS